MLSPLSAIVNAFTIAVCCGLVSVKGVLLARLAVTLFVALSPTGRSLRSRSVKVTEPESDSVVPSMIVPVVESPAPTEIDGVSLLPVIVIVTVAVANSAGLLVSVAWIV